MADRLGLGKQYFSDLLSRLPEGSRTAVEEAFATDEAAPALEYLGESILSRSDYSRAMNDLQKEREAVQGWKATLDAYYTKYYKDPTPPAAPSTPDPSHPASPSSGLSRKDVEELLAEREAAAAAYINTLTPLALKHYQTFGEVLDANALLKHPQVRDLGLLGVYDLTTKDRYEAKAKEARDQEIDRIVAARLAEERKKIASTPPHLVAPHEPSPLDVLEPTDGTPPQFSAAAAAEEYQRLIALKNGSVPS